MNETCDASRKHIEVVRRRVHTSQMFEYICFVLGKLFDILFSGTRLHYIGKDIMSYTNLGVYFLKIIPFIDYNIYYNGSMNMNLK